MKAYSGGTEPVRTNTPNCPKCGAHMLSKTNRWGKRFWGCSEFINGCKGTRNTDGDAPVEEREDNKEDEPQWSRRYD